MDKRKISFVIVPIILFAFLAVCIHAGIANNFEGWVYSEAAEKISPPLTNMMKVITNIGDSTTVITFCILLFIMPKSRRTIAMPVSITVILSGILNVILKNIFERQRPNILRLISETGYSFPSGHAMINASLYTMLILLIFKFVKGTAKKITLSSLCAMLAISIGYSRIYLGVHYAGDVFGGWLFGISVSVCVYSVWRCRQLKESPQGTL